MLMVCELDIPSAISTQSLSLRFSYPYNFYTQAPEQELLV